MNTKAILDHLDDDLGMGHGFYDPYIKDDVEINEKDMAQHIEIGLESHAMFREPNGRPTTFALNASRFLKRFRSDREYAEQVTKEACAVARKMQAEWDAI
jgi:hypothetical protein